jgi:hypothetical protein
MQQAGLPLAFDRRFLPEAAETNVKLPELAEALESLALSETVAARPSPLPASCSRNSTIYNLLVAMAGAS